MLGSYKIKTPEIKRKNLGVSIRSYQQPSTTLGKLILGLTKNSGSWFWEDGANLNYTNWADGDNADNTNYTCAFVRKS